MQIAADSYIAYNIYAAAIATSSFLWCCKSKHERLITLKTALLITFIAHPWDFFAIEQGVWTYPKNPGPMVFGVPLNDLVFIFLASVLTCSILTRFSFAYKCST